VICEMNVHSFGATSSPFCANFALRRTAEDNAQLYSEGASTAVKNNFYVDDCLVSVGTVEEAVDIADELMRMLQAGGFRLTKWMSNSSKVMQSVLSKEDPKDVVHLDIQKVGYQRALGLQWGVADDTFLFVLRLPETPFTKRGILKCIAFLYDPLGFVSPMILPARKSLQDLSSRQVSWDTEIEKSIKVRWVMWLSNIESVKPLRINRYLTLSYFSMGMVELHLYSDASEMGYGAVAFLRFKYAGTLFCHFLLGKSRVTPVNGATVPRLELVAAVLSTRLMKHVITELPACRVSNWRYAFDQCGIDYFSPLKVEIGRSEHKRYGCLFTCLHTRAIHLEIAHSMTADSFLMAITRFMARRGKPNAIYSDNGSNFIAGESELKVMLHNVDQRKIEEDLLRHEIQWNFQPPNASHRGGLWESMIRSVRRVLAAVSNQQRLTDESLLTFVIEVERIVNDRPLVPVYDDPDAPRVLRPSDLLLLRPDVTSFDGEMSFTDRFTKYWRQAQHLTSAFWKRWVREYLPTLQVCQKWLHERRNVRVGDIVLLLDGGLRCGRWPKGVVTEAFLGNDGHVRHVLVKTQSGILRRDIRSLSLLEAAV
ncbi:DDE-type integrase/transposase/recombinase, partial [Streptococcus dysgalactiae]|uniref:DDE-type integrase/transposase/recombinase n=1 Tax=Streptococcus dysgalactiae TaxID=1334 RepID=UPI00194F15C6